VGQLTQSEPSISSNNFFSRHADTKIVYRNAKEFRMIGKYLFVTKVHPEKKVKDASFNQS